LIFGPIALVMAIEDLRAMRAGHMDPSGQGLTWFALVIAGLSTVAIATAIGLWLMVALAGV
jgi:hypothetical protein